MKNTISTIMACSVLSITIMTTSAIAGQKTLPHWSQWPGTIWSATKDTSSGPIICEIASASDSSKTVKLVAQSAQDCIDVGGIASV